MMVVGTASPDLSHRRGTGHQPPLGAVAVEADPDQAAAALDTSHDTFSERCVQYGVPRLEWYVRCALGRGGECLPYRGTGTRGHGLRRDLGQEA
jgi:hypothetical protein